jgi:hypothetical protein
MTPGEMAAALAAGLNGPHGEDGTTGAADLAAEAIRFLNYATGPHASDGLPFPGTVYSVAGNLALAAGRLEQLFRQIGGYLTRELAAGRLGEDSGADPAAAVDLALYHLSVAAAAAGDLAAALSAVQSDLSGTHYRPDGAR